MVEVTLVFYCSDKSHSADQVAVLPDLVRYRLRSADVVSVLNQQQQTLCTCALNQLDVVPSGSGVSYRVDDAPVIFIAWYGSLDLSWDLVSHWPESWKDRKKTLHEVYGSS